MDFIKTKSFTLATYQKGSAGSSKLALVLPGRLDTKDYPNMRGHVDFLASRGFIALSFDPPGTWESLGDISIYTMTNYIKAVDEMISYFGNLPTFVVGHSRGGSIAMLAGTRNKNIRAFTSIFSNYSFKEDDYNGFSDNEWKNNGLRVSRRELSNNIAKLRKFELPYSFYEDQIKYDASSDLKISTKPKLFIAGKKDTTVELERVVAAYNISCKPKQLEIVDSDHDYRLDVENINKINLLIGDFLDKYLI